MTDAIERRRIDPATGVVAGALAQLPDVRPRGEHSARSREDEDARTAFEVGAHRVQRIDHVLIDRVADVGPVEGDDDAVVSVVDTDRSRHRRLLTAPSRSCPSPA